ncbi:MAG: IS4/IS5 family transposase, partial [Aquificales bacterium]|nr:IS4/IS5 family transposase [Aquificales bacterium]
AQKQCEERNLSTDPIRVRLVRVELPSGEVEVLITSLLDGTRFPVSLFQELYHQRWPVEEDYEVLKSRIEVENWSGKSVQAVYQEFHAAIFTKNMAAILAQPAQQEVTQQSQSKKHDYQINMTNLISKMKDTIVYLLRDTDIRPLLQSVWQQMVKTIEPIRRGRSYPRKKGVRRKRFAMNYKAVR